MKNFSKFVQSHPPNPSWGFLLVRAVSSTSIEPVSLDIETALPPSQTRLQVHGEVVEGATVASLLEAVNKDPKLEYKATGCSLSCPF